MFVASSLFLRKEKSSFGLVWFPEKHLIFGTFTNEILLNFVYFVRGHFHNSASGKVCLLQQP